MLGETTVSQIKIGSIKTTICPVCNGLRNCRVEGHLHKNQDVNEYVYFSDDYYILVCLGCDCVFFQKERLDSETIDQLRDPDDNEDPQKYIIKTTWPAVVKRRAPEWFKNDHIDTGMFSTERLDQTLKEVYLAYDNGLYTLASIGIRTCFDIISNLLGLDNNLSFAGKLTKLVSDGHILPKEKNNLNVLVDAGNASAHRGWNPSSEQVSIIMDMLENFIVNAIVNPTKEAKITDLKNTIPPKH